MVILDTVNSTRVARMKMKVNTNNHFRTGSLEPTPEPKALVISHKFMICIAGPETFDLDAKTIEEIGLGQMLPRRGKKVAAAEPILVTRFTTIEDFVRSDAHVIVTPSRDYWSDYDYARLTRLCSQNNKTVVIFGKLPLRKRAGTETVYLDHTNVARGISYLIRQSILLNILRDFL